jgi:hypothetical protein
VSSGSPRGGDESAEAADTELIDEICAEGERFVEKLK